MGSVGSCLSTIGTSSPGATASTHLGQASCFDRRSRLKWPFALESGSRARGVAARRITVTVSQVFNEVGLRAKRPIHCLSPPTGMLSVSAVAASAGVCPLTLISHMRTYIHIHKC